MNHESQNSSPESLKGVPSKIEQAFALNVFEANLRKQQAEMWQHVDSNDNRSIAQYQSETESVTEKYIVDAGISVDDDEYKGLYKTARTYSWDVMGDEEWHGGLTDPENPDDIRVPGRTYMQMEQVSLFGREISRDGDRYIGKKPEEEHHKEPLEELNTEIESLRKDVSMAYAKRMKVGAFRKKRKAELQAELDEKESLLAESITKRDDMKIEQLRASGSLTDDEIVEKLAEQTNEDLIAQANDQNAAMHMIPKSKESTGSFAKLKNWGKEFGVKAQVEFANASTRRKIGYTAVAAAGVTVAAVAAGGFGVAGAAGIVGTRIARSYALKRAQIYKTPEQPEQVIFKNDDGTVKSIDEFREVSRDHRKKVISERIERGDKIKKNAVYGALASSALIGVGLLEHTEVGKEVVGFVKEHVSSGFNNIVDRIKNPDGNSLSMDENPKEELPPPPGPRSPSLDQPQGIFPDTPNIVPEPAAPAPAIELPPAGNDSFNVDTFAGAVEVTRGEGWYQTFGELGIMNQADQAKLLSNDVLMAKLSNMNLAYVDNSIGGWGIKMPADGKMPTDALKLIRETAEQSHLTLSR